MRLNIAYIGFYIPQEESITPCLFEIFTKYEEIASNKADCVLYVDDTGLYV